MLGMIGYCALHQNMRRGLSLYVKRRTGAEREWLAAVSLYVTGHLLKARKNCLYGTAGHAALRVQSGHAVFYLRIRMA